MSSVLERIRNFLDEKNIEYTFIRHEFVHRSEEAAKVRGTRFEEAAKALVCKADDEFLMAVIPGPKKMDYSKLKKKYGFKHLCLASPEEVLKKTGLTIGSVPPFGNFWNMRMFIESSLLDNEFMVFSAGTHYDSIRMKVKDYLNAVPHVVEEFRKE